ncbi:class III extradiol dioxygenase family protein [Pseudooceanicola sp. HF7]|uniref:class III extradiol dioxygenase family protein n=1 Tax=Pseudooceanicola sp. HF7 TaxID=2721560 RepID=UPI001431C531|nr:class III extradiol dioxygenase family protein [Pseudooceanicola sp. HF7]NIZ10876.1 protocatechuate 3,4-dioxygenase [Pseudooceanicola sp. HF7]
MAEIIGGLGTSHVPSICVALDKGIDQTPQWKPFFDGYDYPKQWMKEHKPDIAVVIFNDHGNAMFLDRVPTFTVGVADTYKPSDEGWGPRAIPDFAGAEDLGWHFADKLVERHFDPMIAREITVDHGCQVPMELFFGRPEDAWPVKILPIWVNTVQFPIPTPQRCWDMGRVLREAIESFPGDERVVILGTGGLSHQLQGARAGFLNEQADRDWLATFASDPDKWRSMSREDYVEKFGSEGAELIMWLVMRAAMQQEVTVKHTHYHLPASMTGAGCIVLENA